MTEKHADPIDEASALASALTEGAIAVARAASAQETHPDFDGETCVECGDDMPPERLKLGRVRCVRCQSALEHKKNQYARPNVWGGTPLPSASAAPEAED